MGLANAFGPASRVQPVQLSSRVGVARRTGGFLHGPDAIWTPRSIASAHPGAVRGVGSVRLLPPAGGVRRPSARPGSSDSGPVSPRQLAASVVGLGGALYDSGATRPFSLCAHECAVF